MRDRQPVGNIIQQEVVEATCSSAQVPTVGIVISGITPDPVGIITRPFFPGPSPGINDIPQPPQPTGKKLNSYSFKLNQNFRFFLGPSSVLGYQPCIPTNEWYVSQPTIRCSPSFAATGYAPDPKDCSKYYACEGYVGPDGMSTGKTNIIKFLLLFILIGTLMQCLAGLWWDQQRRTCVLPSEVACNPYNIINSQGQAPIIDNNPNSKTS